MEITGNSQINPTFKLPAKLLGKLLERHFITDIPKIPGCKVRLLGHVVVFYSN